MITKYRAAWLAVLIFTWLSSGCSLFSPTAGLRTTQVFTTSLIISDFEPEENWQGGEPDIKNVREGTQAYKISAPGTGRSTIAWSHLKTPLDLSPAVTIHIWVFIDDVRKISPSKSLAPITLKLADSQKRAYWTYNIFRSELKPGWNEVHTWKSNWVPNNSPSWASINRLELLVRAKQDEVVSITFDHWYATDY